METTTKYHVLFSPYFNFTALRSWLIPREWMSEQDQRGVDYRVECSCADLEVCALFDFHLVLIF